MRSNVKVKMLRIGLLLAFLAVGPICSADSVIVASTSPDYAAGQVIGTGQGIELAEGESVRLLTGSGRTLTIRGPYSGVVEEGSDVKDKGVTPVLVTLLSGPAQDNSTLGATRSALPLDSGAAPTEVNDDAMAVRVDVTRSGKYCIRPGAKILISRPADSREDRLSLTNQATSSTETLVWGGDARAIEWQVNMPAEGELQFLARLGLLGGPVRLELIPVTFESDEPGAMAVRLLERGCQAQAQPLLRQLAAQPLK
jgi:hypothetical protein